MEIKDFLTSLSEGTGVSGHEGRVAEVAATVLAKYADEVTADKLGNVIALKKGEGNGPRPKIMLAAHMDEIGLMVTKIEEPGLIRFCQVGGVDQRLLPALEVVVHGKRDLDGIISVKPPHLTKPEEVDQAIKMEDMVIDVGLPADEVRSLVEVGNLITFKRDLLSLGESWVAGKAMDDRAGVAVLLGCLKHLAKLRHTADVYAVATVQEEVGLRGATTSAYGINPDIGIAIDVGHGEMPGLAEHESLGMDKGPAICMGGNIHPKVFAGLKAAATANGIDWQLEVAPAATGTDAWAIQITRDGIPTGLISLPLRYMHTPVETLALGDVEKAGRLLAHFIASVDQAFMEGLKCC